MDDYDPRSDQRQRRARRLENEADDAWSAADEEDLAAPDLDIEDLAAGYEWNDPDPLLDNLPLRRRSDSRPYIAAEPVQRPHAPLTGGSYDPARGYPAPGPLTTEQPFDPYHPPARPDQLAVSDEPSQHSLKAYCGYLVLVVLGMIACGALVLAFALVRGLIG